MARALHERGMLAGLVTDWWTYGKKWKAESGKWKAESGKPARERFVRRDQVECLAQGGQPERSGVMRKTSAIALRGSGESSVWPREGTQAAWDAARESNQALPRRVRRRGRRESTDTGAKRSEPERSGVVRSDAESGDDGKRSQKSEVRSLAPDLRPLTSVVSQFFVRCLSSAIRSPSALAARCEAIPDELVYSFPFRSLLWKWQVRRLARQGRSHEAYLQTDNAFASAVSRLKVPPHEVFFGYSYASLEALEAERKRGVFTVLDQIDPGPAEFRLVAEEMARFPELAGPPQPFPTAYYARNRREWELADIIVVNSEWSREALVAEGADPAKIEIIPLAYEKAESEKWKAESGKRKVESGKWKAEHTLRVLWLGQVNVRKGIHYLIEAARLLEQEPVEFDIVGPIGISESAIRSAPGNMAFHGRATRDATSKWYLKSDVFVLPTLSDGFALTQLEAMAHGLPVIATPNCGRVVEDGKTGFLIPPCDSRALADAVLRFVTRRTLAGEMAAACQKSAEAYSLDNFADRLIGIIEKQGEKSERRKAKGEK